MDVRITTTDPDDVDADDIREALELYGYYVATVTIEPRG